ncbi:BRCT domain-containing protein [Streptomyces buecherae]|uniref:hypothetical protein n=1 Tax=Streptomyces buecherae TaxID=2763006 RepID=UPI00365922E1
MSAPLVPVPEIAPDVLMLLAAVREALTIPLPALSAQDEAKYGRLLQSRAADVRAALDGLLRMGVTPANAAQVLRDWATDSPATYAHWEPGGGPT